MEAMTEKREPVKIHSNRHIVDCFLWELGFLPYLKGKQYRDQFALLSGRTKPVWVNSKPKISDSMVAYYAIRDCLRDDRSLFGNRSHYINSVA